MITVMGATGHVGSQIAALLLSAGAPVRALARSDSKLSQLRNAGAEVLAGDAADAGYLTNAFRGSDAVFTMLPYDPHQTDYVGRQNQMGEAIVQAVREANVPYVVALSSVGADQVSGTGAIETLGAQERRLRALQGTNVLALRPGAFFETFYGSLDTIRQHGMIADVIEPDLKLPMIATRDIAEVAAHALMSRDWKGFVTRELLGPRDLSYAEATRIIGERIGNPDLKYVQLPYDDMAAVLAGAGFAPDLARLIVEMGRGLNERRIKPLEVRTASNPTQTRFEDFAADLAAAYRSSGHDPK